MCRARVPGQDPKRCPSHKSARQVQARNERRREAYRVSREGLDTSTHKFPPLGKMRAYLQTEADFKTASRAELEHLTEEHRTAINEFSSQKYKAVSKALYKGGLDDAEEESASQIRNIITGIDAAFMEAPLKNRVVYRGVQKDETHLLKAGNTQNYVAAAYSEGNFITIDGFQSTTVDPRVAADYSSEEGGLMFEMVSLSGMNISDSSQYAGECEVLLPRKTHWKVVGVHEDADYSFKRLGPLLKPRTIKTTVVQLIEVDEDGSQLTQRKKPPKLGF